MKSLKTTMLTAAILLCVSVCAQNVGRVHVSGISIVKNDTHIDVSFTVCPRNWHLGLEHRTTVTPQLISADNQDTVTMPPFTVAGKNAWYQILRDSDDTDSAAMPLRAGKDADMAYSVSIPCQEWMDRSRLDFVETASCYCDGDVPGTPVTIPVAEMDWRKKKFRADFRYTTPSVDTVKTISLSGRASIIFRINRTRIEPDYMNNRAELQKILRMLRAVHGDPRSAVHSITIVGYASPEGSYANNDRLAKGRTEAIRNYILSQCPLNPRLLHASSQAEDWAGLRSRVESSDMAGRDAILAIIDSDRAPDDKEKALRSAYPKQYRSLLGKVYPSLRHTEYTITYSTRKYNDLSEIRRMMDECPDSLTLNELFIGAVSYSEGSPEYAAAFELAASLYPDSETAHLNTAMAAMACGDFPKAGRHLDRAGSGAEAEYARGIFRALQGDCSGALPNLHRAHAGGCPQAGEAIVQIRSIENDKGTVTFLCGGEEE